MLLLAIDTSGAAVTAAVHDGCSVLAEQISPGARHHAELLTPVVEAVLTGAGAGRSELTGIVVGVGPGPFTGLRVGLVSARVLGYALDIEVYGVCSLDALAEQAASEHFGVAGSAGSPGFVVATDARRREVYWAGYAVEGRSARRIEGPDVAAPSAVPHAGRPVVGRGAELYPEDLGTAIEPLDGSAGWLAAVAVRALGESDGGLDGLVAGQVLLPPDPLYLRRPDAVEPGARKRVLR